MHHTIVDTLPPITPAQKDLISNSERTSQAHRDLQDQTPAMRCVQRGGAAKSTSLPADFTVAAWNMERCYFPTASAQHLAAIKPSIVMLSEMDHGMARTSQRHGAEDIAAHLGMDYIFGVEFFELGLGGKTELPFCKDDFNSLGWHGNALLSAGPIKRAAMIRMLDDGYWFGIENGSSLKSQARLGGRMALLAEIATQAGDICVVSTHLESHCKADRRQQEFEKLLDAVDEFAPGRPVLIGGDLNTGNFMPDNDWRHETLFAHAKSRGYSWDFTSDGTTTRSSLITPNPRQNRKLDWIAGRGLIPQKSGILSSVAHDGTPLSDHDCVWSQILVPKSPAHQKHSV